MNITITTSRILNRGAALRRAQSFSLTDRAKRVLAFLRALQYGKR